MSAPDLALSALVVSIGVFLMAAGFSWGWLLGARRERTKRVPWVRSIPTKSGGR